MRVDATPQTTNGAPDLALLSKKYEQEKQKRLRPDGNAQYLELNLNTSSRLKALAHDPWVDHAALNAQAPSLRDGDDVRLLVLGAGYGGLLYAVRFLEIGFAAADIRLVDTAGGFGGTWYWNRYPGLMCDVESSIYMPLLEETGYMPKHRFSYGSELRQYADDIAAKWNLADKAVFRTQIRSVEWNDTKRRWRVTMTQDRGPDEQSITMTATSQFVVMANGVLNHPKAPKIPGLETFDGQMMHTGRWDYGISGGSPENWNLDGLKGKRVGVVGTGATAIQCVPQLAKWADQLYVFQRTPSAVDERGQRQMTADEWKAVTAGEGWWRSRNKNFHHVMAGIPVPKNLVDDGWTNIDAYKYLSGAPHEPPLRMEDIPAHVGHILALDAPRTERLRQRAEEIVTKDKKTAEALKAWYPSYCKRPCFHDEYLPSFNLPHVSLVDTQGKGIDKVTPSGIVVGDVEYELDIIVWATGYRAPNDSRSEPGRRSNAIITGRDGKTLAQKWLDEGPGTLHGVFTHGFPNLVLTGPSQAAASANWMYVQDVLSRHATHIVSEAFRRAEDATQTVAIEPAKEAEEAWTSHITSRVAWLASLQVCGPSYFNNEGQKQTHEEMMKTLRGAHDSRGIPAYEETLEQWRAAGGLQGIDVTW
ncbi:flavin-binding monooxygenase-like family protein [Purpureocillium lilacinum]|uniref:Flavin-binding monooxygenase-like family protein n=1 Tax=Purpureocillium lilacinum TaxID=33203 RepID=A0A179I1G4_PURLI|nr:flavin-binding monooxygenase-like family protein [Purpureocillium lilacinum]OAQ95588.1 flavin-binding monooxygenase-like family protein [Purpureocillium lilacinum]